MGLHIQWVDPASKLELQTNAGLVLTPGDVCYWDGTDLIKSDADAIATIAEFIAVNRSDGDSDENGDAIVAKRCTIYDDAAGFTVGPYYLSTTLGEYTTTRPTGNVDVRQQIGYAHTTSYLSIDIRERSELRVPIVITGGTSAWKPLDTGDFHGVTLDASGEIIGGFAMLPENLANATVKKAVVFIAASATVGTPTMDITVSSVLTGEVHDAIEDTTLADQVREGAAVDKILELDISGALNATNIIRPGAALGFSFTQDDGGTDISFVFGGYIVVEVC